MMEVGWHFSIIRESVYLISVLVVEPGTVSQVLFLNND